MAIGRISGPLLKENLVRNGINLAFETDLLYLDVVNQRIGIKTVAPTHELQINGTTKTTNLIVSNIAEIGDVVVSGNTISSTQQYLNLGTFDNIVYQNKLRIDSIDLEGNVISTNDSNANLELKPNGTGEVRILSDLNVDGNINVTGNIRADGTVTIGDANTDNIVINAEIASDIIPDVNSVYSLGSNPGTGGKEWNNVWVNNLISSSITSDDLTVDGIDLTLRQGKIYYVAENGSDAKSGNHPQDPFASVKHALSVATAGETIHIYPGVYEEIFPLTIPAGVTIRGQALRSVKIVPTLATKNNDAFLLNGETTIEDITIADFYSPGYAFRYAPGFTVTSRSPYIKNISVITKGSVTTLADPRGFNAGDAGKGAYLDGAVANSLSNEAACLFHSVTFITPGVDAIVLTNGVRVEWLNSFTYFANRSIYAVDGASGLKGAGQTSLRVDGLVGSIASGQTISYYDTDGVTLLESATIVSVDGTGKIFVSGKQSGFETAAERGGKTITANGDAKLSTSVKKFGTASLALDGTGDYANVQSNSDFNFGTSDFCLEAWVYPTSTGVYRTIFDMRTASPADGGGIILGITDTNQLYFYHNFNFRIGPVGTVSQNTWSHIALSRVAGNTRAFINGTQVGSTYVDTNNYAERPFRIGADPNGSFALAGYIDDVRIVKGAAVYTANFTAPTSRVPVTPETVLMARFDGANNSTTFTDDVIYSQDIRFSGGATATGITLADFTDFGAEVRLIGSASVYGNFGLVGDGPGVIMYAIGQNLAYIGNGKEVTNDPLTVIQGNEVVQSNDAKIYYTSVDHKGDFRVGDLFYVNQEDGTVDFSVSNFTINTTDGVTFTDGSSSTFIDGTKIETGNWRISGNTVETLTGDANFEAGSGEINLNANVNVIGSLDVTGNVTIGGNIVIGDAPTDTIQIVAGIDSDIIPRQPSTYSLGTSSKTWSNLYAVEVDVDGIEIRDNYIETTVSNADLELRANGTGKILVPSNNVEIAQDLTVEGTTTLSNTIVNGDLTLTGPLTQTGNFNVSNDLVVGQNLTVNASAQFEEILIDDNYITTTSSNANLELRANGTGIILIPNNNVNIVNNLSIGGNFDANNLTISGLIISDSFTTGNILVNDNYITTTISNSNLELRANGTGRIVIPNNDVEISADLLIAGDTSLQDTEIFGTLTHVGNVEQTGNINLTGNFNITGEVTISSATQFENIRIENNVIRTTLSNSDLELRATQFGDIIIPTNDVNITRDLYVTGAISVGNILSTGSVTANSFSTGNILIDDNVITTTVSNSDLELRANGTGEIVVPSNNVIVNNNLSVNGATSLKNTNIVGSISHIGNTVQTGDFVLTGDLFVSGSVTIDSTVIQFEDIQIAGNAITTTQSNSNLELRANGTGIIFIPANNVVIENNLTVNGLVTVANMTSTGTVTANRFSTGNILIDDNFVTTTQSNSNLELRANGTGSIVIDTFSINDNTISSSGDFIIAPGSNIVNIVGTGAVRLPSGGILQRPTAAAGQIRFNSELSRFEGFNGANWVNLKGVEDLDGNTRITAELTEGANDNIIRFFVDGVETVNIDSTRLAAPRIDVDDIRIDGNTITTTALNTNLILDANGTGSVVFDNFAFKDNVIRNTVNNSITLFENTNNGYVKFTGTYGIVLPVGSSGTRPPIEFVETGQMRFNTTDSRVEIWDGGNWVSVAGSASGITRSEAEDIAFEIALSLG
jgi:hypothetical protein